MLRAAQRLGALRHVKLCQRLALALRADPARPWTVEQLAKKAALSRSSFFERFTRAVGQPLMEYLLARRMAMAKELLRGREGKLSVGQVAERGAWVGEYGEYVQYGVQEASRGGTADLRANLSAD